MQQTPNDNVWIYPNGISSSTTYSTYRKLVKKTITNEYDAEGKLVKTVTVEEYQEVPCYTYNYPVINY